ncbi:MAG TPA: VOC family protein [Chloroflexota bacterium]|nr:VOC family protein [Chloroflexota bacterium]
MAVALETKTYDVGGVLLERPFKVRRLGHFGFDITDLAKAEHFYVDLLGFRKSDLGTGFNAIFLHHGGDHHSLLIRQFGPNEVRKGEVTTNQITWQLGSLREVNDAHHWLQSEGVPMQRVGRDMPGSNWHTYFDDPDGHTNELYYGIEQIGWDGRSKPQSMYYRRFREEPELPQMSEADEVEQARENGIDVDAGFQWLDRGGQYEVDGVRLARPFKITKIGPVRLFVKNLAASEAFYTRRMGFVKTEEITYGGQRCVFLRANTEHHSVALYPVALRSTLGLRPDSSCMSFGVQLATYSQLRTAVGWLREQGCTIKELDPALFPGMGHQALALDPDGHAVQLYHYMEQIGWDGQPRPAHLRPAIRQGDWPETVAAEPDSFGGEVFLGPWG